VLTEDGDEDGGLRTEGLGEGGVPCCHCAVHVVEIGAVQVKLFGCGEEGGVA